jgi:hypothetical protein
MHGGRGRPETARFIFFIIGSFLPHPLTTFAKLFKQLI